MDTPIFTKYVEDQQVRVLASDFAEIPKGTIATIIKVLENGTYLYCDDYPAGLYFFFDEIEPVHPETTFSPKGRVRHPAFQKLPVSSTFVPTTGVKYDDSKPKWSLIPKGVLVQVVEVLTYGSKKYSPNNWMYVEKERYYDALHRHLDAFNSGEKVDPESGKHHLAHALCCVMYMLWHDKNLLPKTH